MTDIGGDRSSGLDWRTLLAFALMILIWIIFSRFLVPRREPAPPNEEVALVEPSTGTEDGGRDVGDLPPDVAVGGEPRRETAVPDEEIAWGAADTRGEEMERGWVLDNRLPAAEGEIVVDGPLFRATFDPHGGTLTSWALKRYSGPGGGPADLVADPSRGVLGLILDGPEGPLDLSATLFAVEQSRERRARSADSSPEDLQIVRFVAEGEPRKGIRRGVAQGEAEAVAAARPRIRVERLYRIDPQRYDMEMELRVSGVSNFRRDHQMILAWDGGMPSLEEQEKPERRAKGAVALLAEEFIKYDFGGGSFGCGCGGGPASRGGERRYEGMLRWAGVRTKYFAGLLVPAQQQEAAFVAASDPTAGRVGMRVVLPLAAEGTTDQRFTVYAGPIDYRIIKEFNERIDREITRIVNFGGKWIAPLSKGAHWFLLRVYSVIPNYGVAILILSILLRVVFHPLTVKSLRAQRKMQSLKPALDRINAEYKDNPELRARKTMEFQKKHGMNPLSGCLPMLVQMPVFIALYGMLMNAIELRKAPFVLWIRDLASPDKVGELAGIPIHILPILMAATMFWQQRMTPTDPRQAPMMMLMPVMLLVFFYSLPSGLVLYWTVTNLLTVAQQMAMKTEPVAIAEEPAAPVKPRRKKQRRN